MVNKLGDAGIVANVSNARRRSSGVTRCGDARWFAATRSGGLRSRGRRFTTARSRFALIGA
jgi:hypothetical protein